MTRRGWIAIGAAIAVNLLVITVALSLDSATGSDDGGAPARVGDVRAARASGGSPGTTASPASTTSTTSTPDPLALPPAPAATPVAPPDTSGGAPVISRVPTTNRVVFVTIDDGLVRDPAVVELVRRMQIPVTMFLVRDPALEGQAYFQQLIDLGGLVEAHTIKHPDLKKLGASGQQTEICGPLDTLEQLYGRRPVLFRPPYGSYNATTKSIAASCGYRYIVTWMGAANDGRIDMQDATFHPGDIILFHFRPDLAQNLQLLDQLCKQQGFTVARLEDYLTPG